MVGIRASATAVLATGWHLDPAGASRAPQELLQRTLGQLREYFAGQRHEFDLPWVLPDPDSPGTRVLQTLADTVGYGETVTYGELALRSGTGLPARVIGQVLGANPLPLLVPCHRVVAEDGLGGYSGGDPGHGIATKRWLLENEGALPPRLC